MRDARFCSTFSSYIMSMYGRRWMRLNYKKCHHQDYIHIPFVVIFFFLSTQHYIYSYFSLCIFAIWSTQCGSKHVQIDFVHTSSSFYSMFYFIFSSFCIAILLLRGKRNARPMYICAHVYMHYPYKCDEILSILIFADLPQKNLPI